LRVVRTELVAQRLALRSGRVDVALPHEAPVQQLSVDTPDAEVQVVGTVFSVEVQPVPGTGQPSTVVAVSEGEVRVIRRGGSVTSVLAGQRWASAPVPVGEACEAPAASAPRGGAQSPSRSELTEQNRLYRAALEARNAGDDARALRTIEGFIARYPKSLLAQEAQVERFRLLERMGRHGEAAQQARRYLAEHEGGFARDEAREIILPPTPSSARSSATR
jgi:TolA-binding protein